MTSLRHNVEPRDAYLDSARDCILDVGWRRTTLTEVARRAGVSRMTIYRTWSDMPQLLGDLMTREWGGVVAAAVDTSAPARIVELDPELLLPYLLSRRGRSQQAILDLVTEQLRLGQASGEVRAGDPHVL